MVGPRVRLVAAVVAAFLAATAAPAAADPVPDPSVALGRSGPHTSGPDNSTPYWLNNSLTGYCGQTDGGYVIAAQSFLYAAGSYPGPVDNYWGPNSHRALVNYQASRGGLQQDGCAGPETWNDMQDRVELVGVTANCRGGAGELRVYRFQQNGRTAVYDRATATRYWYTDPWLQPRGAAVGGHLYRFSDDLVARC